MTAPRLTLDMTAAQTFDETELLAVFRDSCANDKTMLFGLLNGWATLSPAQRGALYRVADLFVCANNWKRGQNSTTAM